jgi:hypothetical protein
LPSASAPNCASRSGFPWSAVLFSQIITLLITPMIYLAFDRHSGNGPLKLEDDA